MTDSSPGAERLPLASAGGVWRSVRQYVRAHRALTVTTTVLAALAVLSGLVAPWAIGILVDTVLTGGEVRDVVTVAAAVAAAGVLAAGLTAAATVTTSRTSPPARTVSTRMPMAQGATRPDSAASAARTVVVAVSTRCAWT